MQIVDMNMRRVADSNFTVAVEPSMASGVNALVVILSVNMGSRHLGRVVMENSSRSRQVINSEIRD